MATTEPPPLVTECPNCHTRFRVGESQLQIAHGRVRCGACLAVFAGVDHLLLDDAEMAPDLPSETNMLESVLAELAEADDSSELGGEVANAASHGVTAARAYELDALATRRGDTQELELSGGFLAVDEREAAGHSTTQPELESAQDADWTSVSVDTQEFGAGVTLELASSGASRRFDDGPSQSPSGAAPQPRATIEEALNDEEALRWWLEDELPHEENDFAMAVDDSMVVQLSELDMVRDDDDLDLQDLLGDPETSSKTQLEALFRELREDSQADDQDILDVDSVTKSIAASEVKPTSEEALRQVVSDLKADAETTEVDSTEPVEKAAALPPLASSEQSSAELHDAIDQAEPLVTRAMANGALAASANKVAAAERAAEAEQAAERARVSAEAAKTTGSGAHQATDIEAAASSQESALPVDDLVVQAGISAGDRLAAGHGAELVEPPPDRQATQAAGWNSATFPVTPAELVENITEEMAAAGTVQPEVADTTEESALDVARLGLERWLGNPYALRVGTILASVLLVGQVMFWQFDDWAKSPTLRPVYSGLCAVVGCELPLRRSVKDMQSRKLAVRSHPDKPDKLLVDALIINEAEFAQPFPIIELQFMDLSQQVVGSYQLEPDSYLDGELAGSDRLMAVRTPVHIDIEIADPGPTAVNYQLQFR